MTPSDDRVARLLAALAAAGVPAQAGDAFGEPVIDVARDEWATALAVACDAGFDWFDWLSAVDELDRPEPGVRLVCRAMASADHAGVLMRTRLPAADLRAPTAIGVWAGAAWHERETAEMFGVAFGDEPFDPLLLPAGFAGHPLRKAYGLAARAERPWPGAIEPGSDRPGRKAPPGVPAPTAEPRP